MMLVVNDTTANRVWSALVEHLRLAPVQPSDKGPTRELVHVAYTVSQPRQRWVTVRQPPINVAFAIAEVLWILTGRRDQSFLTPWNSKLPEYVGDEELLHGAYGYRLRTQFGMDQIERAYEALQANPLSRQVVLQIWDPRTDLPGRDGTAVSADVPCNTSSYLKVREGRLEWLQVMRSNDLVRGLPYNVVQFTFLQEVIAGWLSLGMGNYTQVADSLHVYERDLGFISSIGADSAFEPISYALPYDQSRRILEETARRAAVAAHSNEYVELRALQEGLPTAFAGLLGILGAERLRRRKCLDEAWLLSETCQDPGVREAWRLWADSRKTSAPQLARHAQ